MRSLHRWISTGVASAVLIGLAASPALAEDATSDGGAVAAAVTSATGTDDLSNSTTSDADSALTATSASSTVDIPRDPSDGIAITTPSGDAIGVGIPGNGDNATTQDGTVVYTDADPGVASAAQATDDGGVRVLVTIADATAAHDYRFPLSLPAGATPALTDGGVVSLTGADGADLGSIAPAWAVDANGAALPSSFSLDGSTLVQHVDFSSSTAFPVVIDPWWNPFSWNWSKIGRVTLNGLKNCGIGALGGVVGLGAGTVVTNVLLNAAGRAMISVAGGPYAYIGVGVAGCVTKMFF